MTSAALLGRGLLIGVLVAAPVGPMALLALRRTLERGWLAGLASGAGIATADAVYAAVAVFGLTALSGPLEQHARWVRIAGGAVLLLLGVRAVMRARPDVDRAVRTVPSRLAGAYASSLLLTLANPPTILTFAAIVGGLGVSDAGASAATSLVLGVLAGSLCWWVALTGVVASARGRVSSATRVLVTRIAGAALAAVGLGILVDGVVAR